MTNRTTLLRSTRRACSASLALLALTPLCVAAPSNIDFGRTTIEMIQPLAQGGAAGFRYHPLNEQQTQALRRRVKLPLNALFSSDSESELMASVEVAPLPDPEAPFLPVASDAGDGDPFAEGSGEARLDPLAELFAAEQAAATTVAAGEAASAQSGVDPFAAVTAESESMSNGDPSDPFAAESAPEESADTGSEAGATSDEADPFADDPFADF